MEPLPLLEGVYVHCHEDGRLPDRKPTANELHALCLPYTHTRYCINCFGALWRSVLREGTYLPTHGSHVKSRSYFIFRRSSSSCLPRNGFRLPTSRLQLHTGTNAHCSKGGWAFLPRFTKTRDLISQNSRPVSPWLSSTAYTKSQIGYHATESGIEDIAILCEKLWTFYLDGDFMVTCMQECPAERAFMLAATLMSCREQRCTHLHDSGAMVSMPCTST